MDRLFDGILSLKTKEECYTFFEDVCTINELLSLSQRYEVAYMLKNKKTYLEIAEKTGLINKISKVLTPLTRLLFPGQRDPETLSCIVMSFMSNIFGTGNSSTVFALRTMEKLDAQNHYSDTASNDMCTFAVVNMAFAPIVPIVTIQLREELGSADPYSIVLPCLISSAATVVISVIVCKLLERRA